MNAISKDKRPVIILGPARAGTHILASTLARNHPFTYVGEMNEVWKKHSTVRSHDMIPPSQATEQVSEQIRKELWKSCPDQDARFLHKTAANSLRPELVHKVFPNALFIHIVRDARDVAFSIRNKSQGEGRKITNRSDDKGSGRSQNEVIRNAFREKLTHLSDPRFFLQQLPRYTSNALTLMGLRKKSIWGPRFPGISAWSNDFSPLGIGAMQWKISVDMVDTWNRMCGEDTDLYELKYEDMVQEPGRTLEGLFQHLGIPKEGSDIVHELEKSPKDWRETLSPEECHEVESLAGNTLQRWGYPLSSEHGR